MKMGVGHGHGHGMTFTIVPILAAAATITAYLLAISISPFFVAPLIFNNNPISYPFGRSKIEAIYQFGDSISDTGNIIRENPDSNFRKLPYSQTFFHKPTRRCSNGRLMIDFIANEFNLPFLDPYLNKEGNFSHGVNFAVAGATALNSSALANNKGIIGDWHSSSSLLVQLDWFKSHLKTICSSGALSECKGKLEKALIMMGEIGGNDYYWSFFQRKPITEIYKMVPNVVQVIEKAIKEVVNLGARRIVVPGNFPIGCMTIYLNMFKIHGANMYDELKCLKQLNNFASFHNEKLHQVIRQVQKDHPNVTIVYADYFQALREILSNASSLGFDKDVMQEACCENCGSEGSVACEHPDKHMNWDDIHFTQHAYLNMAKWLVEHI